MKIEKKYESTQKWILFERIISNGIFKINKEKYLKIIKVLPINFNLKSDIEKEEILNSYKNFLRTCDFNIQIIIQSNKENLSNNITILEKKYANESEEINDISKNYINYIKNLNSNKLSSSKNFYILIENSKIEKMSYEKEEIIINDLNEKFYKIKEGLSRCGNIVVEINEKKETINILKSFYNRT